jgi:hypothetical protein
MHLPGSGLKPGNFKLLNYKNAISKWYVAQYSQLIKSKLSILTSSGRGMILIYEVLYGFLLYPYQT